MNSAGTNIVLIPDNDEISEANIIAISSEVEESVWLGANCLEDESGVVTYVDKDRIHVYQILLRIASSPIRHYERFKGKYTYLVRKTYLK